MHRYHTENNNNIRNFCAAPKKKYELCGLIFKFLKKKQKTNHDSRLSAKRGLRLHKKTRGLTTSSIGIILAGIMLGVLYPSRPSPILTKSALLWSLLAIPLDRIQVTFYDQLEETSRYLLKNTKAERKMILSCTVAIYSRDFKYQKYP